MNRLDRRGLQPQIVAASRFAPSRDDPGGEFRPREAGGTCVAFPIPNKLCGLFGNLPGPDETPEKHLYRGGQRHGEKRSNESSEDE